MRNSECGMGPPARRGHRGLRPGGNGKAKGRSFRMRKSECGRWMTEAFDFGFRIEKVTGKRSKKRKQLPRNNTEIH